VKSLLVFGVVLLSLFFIFKQESIPKNQTKMTYSKALELAKKSNKLIMLKLTSDHCRYCIKMDREVMSDKEVKELLSKHFITVNVNVDHERIPLGIKRGITPTFIFIDKNQKVVSKIPGSWNKRDFIDLLQARI